MIYQVIFGENRDVLEITADDVEFVGDNCVRFFNLINIGRGKVKDNTHTVAVVNFEKLVAILHKDEQEDSMVTKDENCGMCQHSISSADYIPVEKVEEGMVWCNKHEKWCDAFGKVCDNYISSRR